MYQKIIKISVYRKLIEKAFFSYKNILKNFMKRTLTQNTLSVYH